MANPSDKSANAAHATHEIFLLAIIGFIAVALIGAANGAYTADSCGVREPARSVGLGHSARATPVAGRQAKASPETSAAGEAPLPPAAP